MSSEHAIQERWIRSKDADAFAELVSRYAGMVYGTCMRILGNRADAEDVAQECFLEFARRERAVVPSLGGWLHKAAVHRSLNRIRSEERRRSRENQFAAKQETAAEPTWDDVKPHLDEAIAELPDDLRDTVVQRFLEGRTHDAIAKGLGVSSSAVKYRASQGVDRIRDFLRSRGIVTSAGALAVMLASQTSEAAPAGLIAALGERAITACVSNGSSIGASTATVAGGLVGKAAIMAGVALAIVAATAFYFRPWAPTPPRDDARPSLATALEQAQDAEKAAIDRRARQENTVAPQIPAANGESASVGGDVTGRVFDAKTGQGLSGMLVAAVRVGHEAQWNREFLAKANTDENGAYRLTGLPPGDYSIQLEGTVVEKQDDLVPAKTATIQTAQPTSGIDFEVDRAYCVSGRVVNPEGGAVPDARIHLWGYMSPGFHAYTWSNKDGKFVFAGVPFMSKLTLRADAWDLQSNVSMLSTGLRRELYDKDTEELEIVVAAAAGIQGVVVDSSGNAIAQATVSVRGTDGQFSPIFQADGSGRFASDDIPPDTYTITAHRPGVTSYNILNSSPIELVLKPGEHMTDLQVACAEPQEDEARSLRLSGRVTDTRENPVAGVEIMGLWGMPTPIQTQTDSEGVYEATGLREGEYSLRVKVEGLRQQTKTFMLAEDTNLDFVLEDRAVVSGQVIDDASGKPIPEFSVFHAMGELPTRTWAHMMFVSHRDNEGRFTVRPDGDAAQIVARADGYAPNAVFVPALPANAGSTDVVIRLRPGAHVNGIVVDEDGEPVANAMIFLDDVPPQVREKIALAVTNDDGRFHLDLLPEGAVRLCAYHPRHCFGQAVVNAVVAGSADATIRLASGGSVAGIVTTAEEQGIDIISRSLVLRYVDGCPFEAYVESEGGSFRFENVPEGDARVMTTVFHPSLRSAFFPVQVRKGDTTEVTIDFTLGTASVEGCVLSGGRPMLDGGKVTLSVESPNALVELKGDVRIDGTYHFERVPAGTATLTAEIPGPPGKSVTLDIADGARIVQDIDIAGE